MRQVDNEALFRTMFNSCPDCVKLLDEHGGILDINPVSQEMVGSSREELLGQPVYKLACEQYQDAYHQLIHDALRGEKRSLEFKICNKQAGWRWVETIIVPLISGKEPMKLFVGITRDIHEKKEAMLESKRLVEENRWLIQQLMEAQEEESREIAQELHDNLGQQLLAIRLDADFILQEKKLDHTTIDSTVKHILELIERISHDVRNLSEQLHPLALKYMGLSDSLKDLVREWKTSQRSMVITYCADTDDITLLPEKGALALYRVLQEGLTNIARHSSATVANILLESLSPDEWAEQSAGAELDKKSDLPAPSGAVRLIIQDNGVGMNLDEITPGRGLLGMRERIGALGGQLLIKSTPPATTPEAESPRSAAGAAKSGTLISAILPLDVAT